MAGRMTITKHDLARLPPHVVAQINGQLQAQGAPAVSGLPTAPGTPPPKPAQKMIPMYIFLPLVGALATAAGLLLLVKPY